MYHDVCKAASAAIFDKRMMPATADDVIKCFKSRLSSYTYLT